MLRSALYVSALVSVATASDVCTDNTLESGSPWHDDGGDQYSCQWYSGKADRCQKYGSKYSFEGLMADQACCVCGGGEGEAVGMCADETLLGGGLWHDDGGTKHNCEWYATSHKRCDKYGYKYGFEDLTADQACCVCGGGHIVGEGEENLKLDAEEEDLVTVVATLRLHNITSAEMSPPQREKLLAAMSYALKIPSFRMQVSSALDYTVPEITTPTTDISNPFAGRNDRDRFAPVTSFGTQRKVTKALDVKVNVQVAMVNVFQQLFRKGLAARTLKRAVKAQLPDVSHVTAPGKLAAPDLVCMSVCGDASPREENGETCYCSQSCVVMGDCCPSFYRIPCEEEVRETWAPTPAGPGSHWEGANQKWNMLDFNQGFVQNWNLVPRG